ncbi:MAG TPA: hypothetical protein VIO94_10475 [Phenylobacterium sp.]
MRWGSLHWLLASITLGAIMATALDTVIDTHQQVAAAESHRNS